MLRGAVFCSPSTHFDAHVAALLRQLQLVKLCRGVRDLLQRQAGRRERQHWQWALSEQLPSAHGTYACLLPGLTVTTDHAVKRHPQAALFSIEEHSPATFGDMHCTVVLAWGLSDIVLAMPYSY